LRYQAPPTSPPRRATTGAVRGGNGERAGAKEKARRPHRPQRGGRQRIACGGEGAGTRGPGWAWIRSAQVAIYQDCDLGIPGSMIRTLGLWLDQGSFG